MKPTITLGPTDRLPPLSLNGPRAELLEFARRWRQGERAELLERFHMSKSQAYALARRLGLTRRIYNVRAG